MGESEHIMNVECVIFLGVFAEMCVWEWGPLIGAREPICVILTRL